MEYNEYLKGTCTKMCSEGEIKMREREHILHVLEIVPGTENLSRPKADKDRAVKAFVRSAAGQDQKPEDLRTPDALLETIYYLFDTIIINDKLPWNKTYDFLADRLRAVRQELIIQNLPKPYIISILQPVVRFYAYAAYRLCEEDINKFDPVLNNKQLQECLKRLLVYYDYYDTLQSKSNTVANITSLDCSLFEHERPFFEALYVLFNLGNEECIKRGLSLPKKWRTEIVQTAINISLYQLNGNWVRVCKLLSKLPILLLAVTSLHLQKIRRRGLDVMNIAYSNKKFGFPIDELYPIFLYDTKNDLIQDCKTCNINCTDSTIYFLRNAQNFSEKSVKPRKSKFIDSQLCNISASSLILNSDLCLKL